MSADEGTQLGKHTRSGRLMHLDMEEDDEEVSHESTSLENSDHDDCHGPKSPPLLLSDKRYKSLSNEDSVNEQSDIQKIILLRRSSSLLMRRAKRLEVVEPTETSDDLETPPTPVDFAAPRRLLRLGVALADDGCQVPGPETVLAAQMKFMEF
mmetsp:Transcript_59140/g.128556  ORF Transcript_59140/g.128556 Transcript_59140/m.128556 type:complete len:153 (-) Transcript_59140:107-565(-)